MIRVLLFVLLCGSWALAQTPDLPTTIPAQWMPLVSVLVGLLGAVLVGPLTAVVKKLGGTRGPSTVAVSAGFSVLIGVGFSVAAAAAAGQGLSWQNIVLSGVISFLKANGDYLTRVFAVGKAATLTPPEGAPALLPGEVIPAEGARRPGPVMEAGPLPEVRPSVVNLPGPHPGLQVVDYSPTPATLGLFDAGAAVQMGAELLQRFMGNPAAVGLLDMLLRAVGAPVGLRAADVAARLMQTADGVGLLRDLFDGDARLSVKNLNTINGAVLDLRTELRGET